MVIQSVTLCFSNYVRTKVIPLGNGLSEQSLDKTGRKSGQSTIQSFKVALRTTGFPVNISGNA